MADNEKKTFNLLDEKALKEVAGGKSQPESGICPYCHQAYENGYQAHKKDCTAGK